MNTERNNKINDILDSLDGLERATPPDFFYTRLKARMEKNLEGKSSGSWSLRPAFAIAALAVVLITNAALVFGNNEQEEVTPLADTEKFQSIASDYSLNDNLAYDLNQEK